MAQHRPRALITGASSGIGEAYARELARRGYDLLLVARREARLRQLAAELEAAHGTRAGVLAADLVQEADLARVIDAIEGGEPLALLVNNAGFNALGRFAGANFPRLLDMLALHMQVSLRLTRAALPGMLDRRRGGVIFLSSVNSLNPMVYSAGYGASKAFLNHFGEALAAELAGSGVAVQVLCPGFTRTGIVDTPEFRESGFAAKNIPGWMWMSADAVVATSLRRLGRGRVLVIPGLLYKGMAVLAWLSNLPLLHTVTRWVGRMIIAGTRR